MGQDPLENSDYALKRGWEVSINIFVHCKNISVQLISFMKKTSPLIRFMGYIAAENCFYQCHPSPYYTP